MKTISDLVTDFFLRTPPGEVLRLWEEAGEGVYDGTLTVAEYMEQTEREVDLDNWNAVVYRSQLDLGAGRSVFWGASEDLGGSAAYRSSEVHYSSRPFSASC